MTAFLLQMLRLFRFVSGASSHSSGAGFHSSRRLCGSPLTVTVVRLPQLSPSMSCGRIRTWYKQEGQLVSERDTLFDIETTQLTEENREKSDGLQLCSPTESASQDATLADVSHVMEVESQDEGIMGPVRSSSKSEPINSPVAILFESAEDSAKYSGCARDILDIVLLRHAEATQMPLADLRAVNPSSCLYANRREGGIMKYQWQSKEIHPTGWPNDFVTRDWVWQAYVKAGHTRTGQCVPDRAAADASLGENIR